MAILTSQQLHTEINTYITDPLNNQITPAIVRMILGDIVDSVPNLIDSITASSIISSPGAVNGGISSAIIGSPNSVIANGVTNSVIIGGNGVTVTHSGVVWINGQELGVYDLATTLANGNTSGGSDIIMNNNTTKGGNIVSLNSNAGISIGEQSFNDNAGKIHLISSENGSYKTSNFLLEAVHAGSSPDTSTSSQITGNAHEIIFGTKWYGFPAPKPVGGYSYLQIDQDGSKNNWYSGTVSSIITIESDDLTGSASVITIEPQNIQLSSKVSDLIIQNGFNLWSDFSSAPLIELNANSSGRLIVQDSSILLNLTSTSNPSIIMDNYGFTMSNIMSGNLSSISLVPANNIWSDTSNSPSITLAGNINSINVSDTSISINSGHSGGNISLSSYDNINIFALAHAGVTGSIQIISQGGIDLTTNYMTINGATGASGTIALGTYSLVFTNGILTAF